MTAMRRGELAAAVGVNAETLRYYERRGVIPRPDRSLGGHRLYPPETVTTLRIVKAAQRLGFTLSEVIELLEPGRGLRSTGLYAGTDAKLAEIDAKIADLQAIRDGLVAAREAGCADLRDCIELPECPVPFDS